jgi:hypothetical protein
MELISISKGIYDLWSQLSVMNLFRTVKWDIKNSLTHRFIFSEKRNFQIVYKYEPWR